MNCAAGTSRPDRYRRLTHVAFISPQLAGHLNPLHAVASSLVDRGHTTSFFHPAVPVDDETPAVRPRSPPTFAGKQSGLLAFRHTMRMIGDLAAVTDALCEELPEWLRAARADVIVADQTEAAGGLVARYLGLPYVTIACALPLNEEPDVPPPFVDWKLDTSSAGLRRNRGGYAVSRWISTPLNRVIRRRARQWGLGKLATLMDCASPAAQISQMVRALDFPRRLLPPGFIYTGPLRLPAATPSHRCTTRSEVFVSLGSLQGHRLELLRSMAEACRLLDLQCIVAHGGKLSVTQAAQLPDNTTVEAHVPQREVLQGVRLTLTHGGLNTVLDSLAAAVPLVIVPLAYEQAAIAARVEHAGAGRVVPLRGDGSRMVATLRDAISCVLEQPSYSAAARNLAAHIAASGGADQAAAIIETTALSGILPPCVPGAAHAS